MRRETGDEGRTVQDIREDGRPPLRQKQAGSPSVYLHHCTTLHDTCYHDNGRSGIKLKRQGGREKGGPDWFLRTRTVLILVGTAQGFGGRNRQADRHIQTVQGVTTSIVFSLM